MASFMLSFFPLDVLDEIWDLIESVSEGFLTYSCYSEMLGFVIKVLFIYVYSMQLCSCRCGHLTEPHQTLPGQPQNS